jgi:putative addiction module component (TIGR02574 family)
MRVPFAELFTLDTDERLQLVEDLWDNIARDTVPEALSGVQIEELRRRRAAHLSNPESGSRSWTEIMERARSRHGEICPPACG